VVVDRGHPSWAEVDAEQRERLGDPPAEDASWAEVAAEQQGRIGDPDDREAP
jgi:hypothetical protein